ncbi:MAG: peroxidase family protein [Dyadobacter fermentans]
MNKIPHKHSSSHGGVRGDDLDRRSSQFEGLFGRLFRTLPAAVWEEDTLAKLAGDGRSCVGMSAKPEVDDTNPRLPSAPREGFDANGSARATRLHDDEENSAIDAGYTYLGQFIDHDITFDPASSLQKRNDVNALVDFRTPRLDLDSVYGRGPEDQPYMYDSSGLYFQLGTKLTEGPGGKVIGHDLPRHSWVEEEKTFDIALIGDKRNDENVIVSQLHGIFLKFHNRFVKDYLDKKGKQELEAGRGKFFASMQRQVRWHYQYVVLHDFLLKIVKKEIIESILPHLRNNTSIFEDTPKLRFYHPKNEAFMPIEFAAAAYRFGHSMVRPIYRLNKGLTGGNFPPEDNTTPDEGHRGIDGRQFIFAGIPNRGLSGFRKFPAEWGIDWNLFFDLTGDKDNRVGSDRTQPSYKIDTSLVNPLAFLSEFSRTEREPPLDDVEKLMAPPMKGQIANLAKRNLLRGMNMSLPSGQDVARAMGVTPIPDSQLKVGKATNLEDYKTLPSIVSISTEFTEKAPLWYYVLAEAQHDWFLNGGSKNTPTQLGEVGGRIVAETLIGFLLDDGHSILRQAPTWYPEFGKGPDFDMVDFIKYALHLDQQP